MRSLHFNVKNELCAECSLALRRFVGGMDGVESVNVQRGTVDVTFDETTVDEQRLSRITENSIELLGYSVRH
jgi:copper chaperone CopZ